MKDRIIESAVSANHQKQKFPMLVGFFPNKDKMVNSL
jgi:hypothetical protein